MAVGLLGELLERELAVVEADRRVAQREQAREQGRDEDDAAEHLPRDPTRREERAKADEQHERGDHHQRLRLHVDLGEDSRAGVDQRRRR